jgi:hypothetical protein
MGFRETSANEQTVSLGQMGVIECIERNEFSSCSLECFEVIRVIKTEGGITGNGNSRKAELVTG